MILRRLIPAAILCAALVGAAQARADSIAYIKGGDVWLATPDGARAVQVTRTGVYSHVSQADNGEMIALAPGERLHKLSRSGQVLADFATMVSDGVPQAGPVNRFHGPFAPQISPDGTKVAYEWFNDSYSDGTGCSDATVPPCAVYHQSQGVAISHADRYTGPEEFGLMTGWIYPHWMSADTLLRSFSGAVLTDDAVFTKVGAGLGDSQLDPWFFDDQQGFGVDDVELSRDLRTVVGIAGQSDEKLRVYRTAMHPFVAPDWNHRPFFEGNVPVAAQCSELTGAKFESTSLSPDARGLAYGTGEGVWVASIPDACGAADRGRLAFPGATSPDWGPADVPAGAAATPVPGATKPVKASLRLAIARGSARRGVSVRVTVPSAGTLRVSAARGKRVLARAKRSVAKPGTVSVTLRPRARRGAKLTLTAAFTPKRGAPAQVAQPLTLRK